MIRSYVLRLISEARVTLTLIIIKYRDFKNGKENIEMLRRKRTKKTNK